MTFTLCLPIATAFTFFAFLTICAWACDKARDNDFPFAAALRFTATEAEAERHRTLFR